MSTRLLRSAGPVPTMPDEATMRESVAHTSCAICLDVIDPDDPNSHRLDCDHVFHAKCLVPHLTRDPRCPCCRFYPSDYVHPEHLDDYMGYDSFDDNEDIVPRGPTFKEGIKAARKLAKTNKSIKRTFNTIKKWKDARKDAKKRCKEMEQKLRPLEDSLDEKIEKYTIKMQASFDKKHAVLIGKLKDNRKDAQKARTQYRSARNRVAEKGGWVKPTRISYRRSLYMRD